MLNPDLSTPSAHADGIAHDGASTVEDQASQLNIPFLLTPEVTFLERRVKNVDSFIELLNAYRQGLHANAEAMKELYHHRQRAMSESSVKYFPVLPIPDDDNAFQSFTELGTTEGELAAFKYHVLHTSVGMDTRRPADAHREVGTSMCSPATEPVQHQTWALLHSEQTSMSHRGRETLPWQGVMSEYEKRITSFPPAYAPYPQLATSEHYGRASEIGLDGANLSLSQQLMSPDVFIDTADVQTTVAGSSSGGGEFSEPGVVSVISGGTKRYRCRCGFESVSKGRMDRHRDSLQHSERKYRCSCGRFFTRVDSLKRHWHRKRCKSTALITEIAYHYAVDVGVGRAPNLNA